MPIGCFHDLVISPVTPAEIREMCNRRPVSIYEAAVRDSVEKMIGYRNHFSPCNRILPPESSVTVTLDPASGIRLVDIAARSAALLNITETAE